MNVSPVAAWLLFSLACLCLMPSHTSARSAQPGARLADSEPWQSTDAVTVHAAHHLASGEMQLQAVVGEDAIEVDEAAGHEDASVLEQLEVERADSDGRALLWGSRTASSTVRSSLPRCPMCRVSPYSFIGACQYNGRRFGCKAYLRARSRFGYNNGGSGYADVYSSGWNPNDPSSPL